MTETLVRIMSADYAEARHLAFACEPSGPVCLEFELVSETATSFAAPVMAEVRVVFPGRYAAETFWDEWARRGRFASILSKGEYATPADVSPGTYAVEFIVHEKGVRTAGPWALDEGAEHVRIVGRDGALTRLRATFTDAQRAAAVKRLPDGRFALQGTLRVLDDRPVLPEGRQVAVGQRVP